MNEIKIRDICGDCALDIKLGDNRAFTLYFNSRQNALNVKRIIEVDGSVPNVATVCDVVEVVRCEKCEYGETYDNGISYVCKKDAWATATYRDHFCSYGKRKDGAGQ